MLVGPPELSAALILKCVGLPLLKTVISPVTLTPCGSANNAIAIYQQLQHQKTKRILA